MKLNANVIKTTLAEKAMSLKDWAKKSNVSYITVIRATRQDVDFGYKTIGKLSRGLGVPVESIILPCQ